MSTLRVNAIQNATGGDLVTAKGMARAWVNFNGTGTIAIRSSHNVSSLTDTAQGRYRVNFTTAMADANYCALVTGTRATGWAAAIDDALAPTTATVSVATTNASGNADSTYVNVAVFD